MCNFDMQEKAIRRAEQAIIKSFSYLAEAVQFFWPVTQSQTTGNCYDIAENNLTLQLSRAFSEAGYITWAEIPFGKDEHLDFMAYNYVEDELVFLEIKNSLETIQNNEKDYNRLLYVAKNGIKNNISGFNYKAFTDNTKTSYGLVSLLNDLSFNRLWSDADVNRLTGFRDIRVYSRFATMLSATPARHVMPIIEAVTPDCDLDGKNSHYRFRSVAYALYKPEQLTDIV